MPNHTVEIRPPSVRQETVNVLKAAVAVVVVVAAYLFRPAMLGRTDGRAASRPADLLPFQTLVRDAPGADQRMFRELREGLLEAERIRATAGKWPDAGALANEGIPPFAADPTRKDMTYRWSTLVQGTTVNYVGIPNTAAAPAWLMVVIEPEAGAPPDPAPNDETHHRLPDGTTLHVSIWEVPERIRRSGFSAVQLPQNEGWTQLLVGTGQ
jgi:uncharacterized protein DUF6162